MMYSFLQVTHSRTTECHLLHDIYSIACYPTLPDTDERAPP